MMPRKKKNGSRSDSPEKAVNLHVQLPTNNQYGSNLGQWSDVQRGGRHTTTGDSHVPDKAEQDQRFHQLQDMFQGQIDGDVVYMVLTECDWKVEDSVEKLLEFSQTSPQNPNTGGPTLKGVASSITAVRTPITTMANSDRHHQQQAPPSMVQQRQDLGLNLRSRLPSAPGADPNVNAGLTMLSPRTPSVAGADFTPFAPVSTEPDKSSSIQVALDALESYGNPDLGAYLSSFQTPVSYAGGTNLFDSQLTSGNSQMSSFDSFGLPPGMSSGGNPTGMQMNMDSRPNIEPIPGLDPTRDPNPYGNLGGFYSQTFQPIETTTSAPVPMPPTTYGVASSGMLDPVSPRTAFNSVILGETGLTLLDDHRRPVREDSKDSATSDVSRVSDVSHVSDESIVNMSPHLVPKRHQRQVLRRQNISLDPQERASLEQLIEEVLIGGVDDGVMDSDDSSDDEYDFESGDGTRIKRSSRSEDGTKVTPSQLKVAAKHMKNLPPRFLKRLQATQPNGAGDEEEVDLEGIELEEASLKLEERKKPKKKTGHLLDSLNQYVEDDVPVTDPESEDGDGAAQIVESPGAAPGPIYQQQVPSTPSSAGSGPMVPQFPPAPTSPPEPAFKAPQQPIILRPNVMNYNDLDPDRVVRTPPRILPHQNSGYRQQSRDQTPEPTQQKLEAQQAQQRFSLDAPEFVPRSFNPINPAVTQQITTQAISSPVSHVREGYPVQPGYNFTPRSGSPYTVQHGSPYPGRSGSPYHLGLTSNLSPQMARRTLTGSPIAMVQVAPASRHSPIPPAFFIPKAPQTAAAAAAAATAAMHGHAAGLLPYSGYPLPHPFPAHHPTMRYAVPPGYRPPFIQPNARLPHPGLKFNPKDRLHNASRPSSAPTVVPGANSNPRMAANLQGNNTLQTGIDKHTTPFQKVFGKPANPDSKLDKDGKEAKNLSTQTSVQSKSSVEEDLSPQEKVTLILNGGHKLMVILRGVAGSGKTHLAKELVHDGVILSTDDFFVTASGYEFDYAKIGEAHEWNQKRAKQAVVEGKTPVIIDNTNTQSWEMKPYVLMAVKHDYTIEILEPGTPWKFRAKELAKRNKHGVTKEFIQRMIDRYEHNVTLDTIIASSEKIRVEVEKKQRQAAALQAQQEHLATNADGQPVEERKTKKKTRRGKGRKKKARLRELREAEANKEKEKTGDEASSDEESTPEGDQSVDKSSVNESTTPKVDPAPAAAKSQEVKKEDAPSVASTAKKSEDGKGHPPTPDAIEKEEQSTPEKDLNKDQEPESKVHEQTEEKPQETQGEKVTEKVGDGNVSDESDTSRDSMSEPSTAESQLSQESESDAGASGKLSAGPSQGGSARAHIADVEDMMRDEQLLRLVMSSLEMNLHLMLQTKQGPAQAQIQKLISKYQTSSEVRTEIEEIIKEKMFEGMVNKEVEEITSGGAHSLDAQSAKNLTETDVNSIMDVLDQITNADSDSDNDTNNNQAGGEKPSKEPTPDTDTSLVPSSEDTTSERKKILSRDSSTVEMAYWQADPAAPDQYTVGTVTKKPAVKTQTSCSDSSSSEVAWDSRPKARRERKRPYKKPKLASEEFWNVMSDKQEDVIDSANSSIVSSETGSAPQTPTTPENGVRSRRLLGRNRLAVQFPMPELDPNEKHKLMIKDWQLPDFGAQHVPFSAPAPQVPKPTLDAETYTHPKDFAALQRLLQGQPGEVIKQSAITDEGFIAIKDTKPRVIYEGNQNTKSDEHKPEIAQRLMIHQSCSTQDLEEQLRPDGLLFLKSCFGAVAEDDLSEVLERCAGDVEWAANILLDAGYEYNEQPSQVGRPKVQIAPAGTQPMKPAPCQTSAPAALTETKHYQPPSLSQLCHLQLTPEETLTDNVQEKFVKSSLLRLNSITEFQRQHSTSSLIASEHPTHRTSTSSLDLAPKSPEVFYSPLEAPVSPGSSPFATCPVPPASTSANQEQEIVFEAATGDPEEMVLTLSPALAQQLINLFGPVGFHISGDSLSPTDLEVKLTRKTAKQLHRRWALTLKDSFNSEEAVLQRMVQEDEALAKKIQAEEDAKHTAKLQKNAGKPVATKPCLENPESLKEIMEEQMAIELSKQEYTKQYDNISSGQLAQSDSLATKMKRQKLLKMFPTIDRPSLEEVYKATGYNMTKTVSAIRTSFGVDEPVQNVWTPEAIQAYEELLLRQAVDQSLQDEWLGASEQEESDPMEALEDPQYQDLRAEASAHYQLRHDCFQKAQEAYKRGLRSVATFYSQQGHLHTQKLKEANRRAARKIIQIRNRDVDQSNTIDLHGLHVDETLSVLDELITQRERDLRLRPDRRRDHLYVVTGRGSHSRGGKAKIRPAVISYLNRKSYNFSEDIPGMLKVQMKYRDDV